MEQQCKDCQYYIQHYALDGKKIFRVYCGHCTFKRPKAKRPDAKACENYIKGTSRESEFASKEYLSKALLEHMLRLELFPEISDEGDRIYLGR